MSSSANKLEVNSQCGVLSIDSKSFQINENDEEKKGKVSNLGTVMCMVNANLGKKDLLIVDPDSHKK
jgi:hypothetical protein